MKKAFLYFIAVAACFFCFPYFLYAQPQIRLSIASWSLGRVKEGKFLKKILVIRNDGDQTLEVKVRSSCECVSVGFSKKRLNPKVQAELIITFDTKGVSGNKTEYIFLDSNDPEYPHITWLIEAEITGKSGKPENDVRDQNAQQTETASQGVIYLFSTPSCRYCSKLKEKILPGIITRYNLDVKIREYPVSEPENYEKLILWERKLKDEDNKLPVIIVGSKILGGKAEISRYLENELLKYTPSMKNNEISDKNLSLEIEKRIKSVKILPVVGAGFVDGLNPCAFGAIIFLISFLSVSMKRKRMDILISGLSFSAGVFAAYFLLGLGLIKILYSLKGLALASRILYFIMGLGVLSLALLSIRDYLHAKKSGSGSGGAVLKLPRFFLFKILNVIQSHAKVEYFAVIAFFTGAVISLLELVCTGQIYLPTIMYMLNTSSSRSQALAYLVLYSFFFIIPLIIVFFLFFWGMRSQRMEEFAKDHFGTVKIMNAIIFLFFSFYMLGISLGLF